MPKLPDVSPGFIGQREIPQSSRPIVGYNATQVSDAVGESAGKTQKIASQLYEERIKKTNDLEDTYATTNLILKSAEQQNSFDGDEDYQTYGDRYLRNMKMAIDESAKMISDPSARQNFIAKSGQQIASGYSSVLSKSDAQRKRYGAASTNENIDNLKKAYFFVSDESQRQDILRNANRLISNGISEGFFDADVGIRLKQGFATDVSDVRADSLPLEDKIKLGPKMDSVDGGSFPVGFLPAIDVLLKNEGGYTALDGASGAPAIYGINGKAFPKQYAEAKRIADTDGDKAGKAFATDFYKKEFWDKKGIEDLPSETQAVVFDGVVNHSTSFGNRLVLAARNGATPKELIDMRRQEYQRLADAKPSLYAANLPGWNKRLDAISSETSSGQPIFESFGDWRDFVSPSKRISVAKQAKGEIEAQKELNQSIYRVENNLPLDPGNTSDRKVLNQYYSNQLSKWQEAGEPPEKLIASSIDFAGKRGMVPDALQSMISSEIRTQNPQMVLNAVDTVRRLKNSNPELLNDLPEKDVRYAEHIAVLNDSGIKPEDAIRIAREAQLQPASVIEGRKEEYKSMVKAHPDDAFLKSELNSYFSNDPDSIPGPMLSDFSNAASIEYQMTGNLDAARQMALRSVSGIWGITNVGANPNSYMRYAPEKIYGRRDMSAGDNANWINEQLVSELSTRNPGVEFDPSNLFLTADGSQKPSYYIDILDDEGILKRQLSVNGQPLKWRPEWESSKAAERMRDDLLESVESARKKRAMFKELPSFIRAKVGR